MTVKPEKMKAPNCCWMYTTSTVSLKPGKTELAVTAPGEGDTYKIFLLSLSCTPLAEVWTGN